MIDPGGTTDAILAAFGSAVAELGINWPRSPTTSGPGHRPLDERDRKSRNAQGTYWDLGLATQADQRLGL